ncbi:ribosome maturation factor RimM [Bacillota bacterium]
MLKLKGGLPACTEKVQPGKTALCNGAAKKQSKYHRENRSMETLRLGKIVNAVGLKGELKIYPYTDYKEKFDEIEYVLIDGRNHSIQAVRYLKNMAVLKLEGIDTRTEAEGLKEKELFILRKDAPPLPAGTYYVKDLIGLSAVDESGKAIGILSEVIINSGQDIYMIKPHDGGGDFPLPAVEEFIRDIDMEKGIIVVKLIEGLRGL